jgi:hypothetical protein
MRYRPLKCGGLLSIVAAKRNARSSLLQEYAVKKALVSLSTAFIALGLIGPASPAQAQTVVPQTVTTAPYSAAKESVAQQNARRMAASYLKHFAFSRSGLIAQLEYDGFTTAQAKYGVKKAGL